MLVAPPIGLVGLLFLLSIVSTLCTLWLLWCSVRFWYVRRAFSADFFNRRTVVLTVVVVLVNALLSLFLWPVALTCVLLTLWLVAGAYTFRRQHLSVQQTSSTQPVPTFWCQQWVVLISVLTLVCYGLLGWVLMAYHAQHVKDYYLFSRSHFVLPRDYFYGEIVIPKGSLIYRFNDYPADELAQSRALTLSNLYEVRFPHPVQVGNVWAAAMQVSYRTNAFRLELAHDQHLAPVLQQAHEAVDGITWHIAPQQPALHCHMGDVATFAVPASAPDALPADGYEVLDVAEARFFPSRWGVMSCEPGMIDVPAAYIQSAPWWGAGAPVWTAESLQ